MSIPRIFAHRGSHSSKPESSLAAYLEAIENGADGFECDLRLSADQHLVICHDPVITAPSGGTLRISSSTLAQIQSAWPVITANDLIDLAIQSKKDIAFETKHPTKFGRKVERALASTLASRASEIAEANIKVSTMSFSGLAVRHLRTLPFPSIHLVKSNLSFWFSLSLGAHAGVGLKIDILNKSSKAKKLIQSTSKLVYIWTVNDKNHLILCKKIGVDVIITDDVPLAKSV